jgi:hypothetical protein
MLEKNSRGYVLGIDYPGQPNEHIHFIFPVADATVQKVEQFINNKGVKNFIKHLKETNTDLIHGFRYKLVENSEEDKMRIIGYCSKDSIKYTCGLTQEYISKCINLHWTHKRLDSKTKIEGKSVKSLKPNEVIVYMEDFCNNNQIEYDDPYIFTHMKKQRISFVNVSRPQREILKNEFILMNKDKVNDFTYNFAESVSKRDEEIDSYFYKQQYLKFIKTLMEADKDERHGIIEATYVASFAPSGIPLI